MRPDDVWLHSDSALPDETIRSAALARQSSLTKPPGSLGVLETLAVRLAAMQRCDRPGIEKIHICVFAGDHGVAAEGISAFPQAVTAEMIRNFARGGAAISVLARALGATLEFIDLGTVVDLSGDYLAGHLSGVRRLGLGAGTANFTREAAMTPRQLSHALQAGRDSAERAAAQGAQLYIGGDMGIGNTTSAAALGCALLGLEPVALAGPGAGLDPAGVGHKAAVILRALTFHSCELNDPLQVLQRLGGFEIAALVGACVRCAQLGLPVLIDGFITTAAALVASRLNASASRWWLYAHTSAEPGHAALLRSLEARPLLNVGMRLGEATAAPLLQLACRLHNEMATFHQAGVSGQL
jgi:nicotinate-nucleotide--dimethylbenzimidazole phosphoribosyltransferase